LFASWLESQGFTKQSATTIDPKLMIDLLGAYLTAVHKGHNLTGAFITGQTLRNYAKSAADCLTILTGGLCLLRPSDNVDEAYVPAPLSEQADSPTFDVD
jgi:hypothetical protein